MQLHALNSNTSQLSEIQHFQVVWVYKKFIKGIVMKALTNLLVVLALVAGAVGVVLSFMTFGPAHPVPWIILAIIIIIPFLYNKFASDGYVHWNDKYSVNIPSIDDDHKRLIVLINQFISSTHYYNSKEFEQKALHELVDYTKYHFDREEKLMQDNGYPDYEEHHKQHEIMIKKVNEVVAKYTQNSETTVTETVDFLRDWLINHIQKTDQQYMSFFKDKNIS